MKQPQFSLRTLLILVAVIGVGSWLYVDWVKVQERAKAIYQSVNNPKYYIIRVPGDASSWYATVNDDLLPWHRRLMGDHFVEKMWLQYGSPQPEEPHRAKSLFPEGDVEPWLKR